MDDRDQIIKENEQLRASLSRVLAALAPESSCGHHCDCYLKVIETAAAEPTPREHWRDLGVMPG
jgi:hypothetical protein